MPIIYSYPSKTSPASGDLLLISDVSASNQTKKSTIGDVGTTIQTSLGLVDGSGTLNKISKWSDANTLTDSIITEDPAAPSISISGSLSITGGSSYLFLPSILDNSGSQGTANQVLSASSSGNSIEWITSTSSIAYETGSFTPSISTSGGTYTGGLTNNTTYTKIGNVVNVFWDLTFTSTGGGGTIDFTLPITADSSLVGGFAPSVNTLKPDSAPNVTHMNLTGTSQVVMQSFSNSDYLIAGTGGTPSITTGQQIKGVLTYKAA